MGGTHRSRLIEVPDAIGLRPTPDRVRETLFNWLGQDLAGLRCLDLFAGSGALGFEAASRGAAEVVLVERAPKVFAHLKKTAAQLGLPNVRLQPGDGLEFLAATRQRFDLIFLDPPFQQGLLVRLAPMLARVLTPGGAVYAEAEAPVLELGALRQVKSGKAGMVHYQLLRGVESAHD